MSLELLSTIGTLLTVAIVGATAIAALVQLRHLRAGNQITALLTIGDRLQSERFRDAAYLVSHRLATALEDPTFRTFIIARQRGETTPEVAAEYATINQSALLVGNTYEEIGNLVKNGVIDETLFMDQYCQSIARLWGLLEKYIGFFRDATGDIGLWDNFEYITVRGREFLAKYPTTYPNGVPRIVVKNPWPIPTREA